MTNRIVGIVLVLAIGCGGDDGLTAFEGVYSIDTWTENPDDCNSDGESILANQTDTAFYIKNEDFLGAEFITVIQCPDVATCAAEAADDETINISLLNFEEGNDTDGWESVGAFLASDGMGGPCNGQVFLNLMTSPTDGIIRIETQNKDVMDVGRDSEGDCDLDAAIAMEPDLPCASLEVFEGSFVQDI